MSHINEYDLWLLVIEGVRVLKKIRGSVFFVRSNMIDYDP